jgi:hypothetical protein
MSGMRWDVQWYLPLEHCRSLDDIRQRWQPLLEANDSLPDHQPQRHHDALLAFIGMSALSPHLKLAAILACVSSTDFDPRLALGALDDAVRAGRALWPGSVAGAVAHHGPAMQVASQEDWLGAFVVGRLAGLRDAMTLEGAGVNVWRTAFWNRFFAMASRRGSAGAMRLALEQGADPRAGHDPQRPAGPARLTLVK